MQIYQSFLNKQENLHIFLKKANATTKVGDGIPQNDIPDNVYNTNNKEFIFDVIALILLCLNFFRRFAENGTLSHPEIWKRAENAVTLQQ